jgi:hypothetical protein
MYSLFMEHSALQVSILQVLIMTFKVMHFHHREMRQRGRDLGLFLRHGYRLLGGHPSSAFTNSFLCSFLQTSPRAPLIMRYIAVSAVLITHECFAVADNTRFLQGLSVLSNAVCFYLFLSIKSHRGNDDMTVQTYEGC